MRVQPPCKDCTDREVGCHSSCEKYAEFKKATYNEYENRYNSLKDHNQYVRFMAEQKQKRIRSHR